MTPFDDELNNSEHYDCLSGLPGITSFINNDCYGIYRGMALSGQA